MRDLIIFGAGYPDVVKLVHAINRQAPTWNLVGVVDDTLQPGASFMEIQVLGSRERLPELSRTGAAFVNNVCGSMEARRRVTGFLEEAGCSPATLLHPNVDTAFCELAEGILISEGAILGSRSRVGRYSAIRFGAVVNHDNLLEDHVFVGPGSKLAGYVTIGSGAYLGAGCVVGPHISIGAGSVVGAGAAVMCDVAPGTTVAGVPAKQLKAKQ